MQKSISLTTSLTSQNTYGDRDLLFQAYANILDNAIKFTPEDGQIIIHMTNANTKTSITISDNGSGIQDEEIHKIFNRFYRGEKNRSSSGTGLGLSLVNAVIKLHNGDISVENNDPGLKIITTL